MIDECAAVRESTARVVQQASHVSIDDGAVEQLAQELLDDPASREQQEWDADVHYCADAAADDPAGGTITVQYLLLLDSLNFCFWPTPGLEYEHLAQALKAVVEADAAAISDEALCEMDVTTLDGWFKPTGYELPQVEERARKVRELGAVLRSVSLAEAGADAGDGDGDGDGDGRGSALAGPTFGGLPFVQKAKQSAVALVGLIAASLPGFRDHAVYRGIQVSLLKRAQIVVSDLWGAFGQRSPAGCRHPCAFGDIDRLTMFADYRVPQLLRPAGVLRYSQELARRIDGLELLPAGSEEEVELRAATVQAVERLRAAMARRGRELPTAQVDWLLWQRGERTKEDLPPHHRTLTVFY